MPRSSRHKSSKHSVREVREYSDSEKESGLKEKKGKDDTSSSRHLKDSALGEKRKIDSKPIDIVNDSTGLSNNVNVEAYGSGSGSGVSSSSKKRKEKVDDDRWTGGDNNVVHEMSKSTLKKEKEKEKEGRGSGDLKRSSRREGGSGLVSGFDGEEGKKSGGKVESSKHHRSERKERGDKDRVEKERGDKGRVVKEKGDKDRVEKDRGDKESGEKEGGLELERKGSRSERLVDIVSVSENLSVGGNNKKQGTSAEVRSGKHGFGNTACNIQEEIHNPEPEKDVDRRVRRRRDGSGDGYKHQDGVRDHVEKRLSSKEDISKSGKYKDEKTKDGYLEDVDKDNWHQDEKQRDKRPVRDYAGGRSDDNHLRNDKKELDASKKKSRLLSNEYDRELYRDREPERDNDRDRGKGRYRDCDRDRDHELDPDHNRLDHDQDRDRENDNRDHNIDHDRDRDLERIHGRDRGPERDRERVRDRYRRDCDRDRVRDRDRGIGRDYDHDHGHGSYAGDKDSRYKDERGRRRSPDGYDDYHADKSRSVSGSSRRRTSPSARSYTVADKYRDSLHDEIKYGDSLRDDTVPEAPDKVPNYRSAEKHAKFDDNVGEFSERSPSTKASPAALKERSPSSTSFDRRFLSRNSRRRSLDVDESERSVGSNDIRNVTVPEDRHGRDYSAKKSLGQEYPPPESSFYHKSGQANISSHGPSPGPSGFRSGADSPSFVGSLGEDNRGHSGNRYRRSVDPHVGRGPGSAWKGIPNWSSPLPNGFMAFPPGPPGPHHGGFPPIISQFPPLFSARPSLDMNHPGIPYHIPDGDRFPGHVRPIGWPNMVDGPVPPHFHGWDANNGVLRDGSSMYGPGHLGNTQRRDMNADMWKLNGDANMDVTSMSQRDAHLSKASADEASSAEGISRPNVESSCIEDQGASLKEASSGLLPMKGVPTTLAKVSTDKTPESASADDYAHSLHAYLAKLDISMDLADAELYNQWINLVVKGGSECYVEEVQFDLAEDKDVVASEITDLTVGVNFFPGAKHSIFQKAMNLYKTQSTKRRITALIDGEKLCSQPASQLEVDQILMAKDEVDTPVDSIEQENTLVVPEETVPVTCEGEGKEPVCSSEGGPSGGPLQSSEPALDVDDESQMPVLDVEKIDEDTSETLTLEDVDKGQFPVESTIDSNADGGVTISDGGKTDVHKFAPAEQLDVAVSDPLILSSDSVKVCEALISVSNESESVILSRIHHAPESTH